MTSSTPLVPVYPNWFVDQVTDQPVSQALDPDDHRMATCSVDEQPNLHVR